MRKTGRTSILEMAFTSALGYTHTWILYNIKIISNQEQKYTRQL
ncbi:Uncharacterised protein [Segatella copri]|nr:Uncharacterised protein [Segatella copri]